jgi:hypothetical protein
MSGDGPLVLAGATALFFIGDMTPSTVFLFSSGVSDEAAAGNPWVGAETLAMGGFWICAGGCSGEEAGAVPAGIP